MKMNYYTPVALVLLVLATPTMGQYQSTRSSQRLLQGTPEKRFKMPEEHRIPPPNPSVNQSKGQSGDSFLLVSDSGSAMRLSVNGIGHLRVVSDSGYPFSMGWDSSINLKAQPNKDLSLDVRFDMNQQSVRSRYQAGTLIRPKVGVTWVSDIQAGDFYQTLTRVGDLRRMTTGKGLFYKEIREDGVAFQWVGRTQQIGLSYAVHGLVATTDIVTVDWSNSDRTLGTLISTTLEDRKSSEAFDTKWSLYGKFDVIKWFDLNWETAISRTPKSDALGYSVLIAPSKEIKGSDAYFYFGATYRGYFGSSILPYQNRPLAEVESTLFDEELDLDSMRSVIIVSDFSNTIQSGALRIKYEQLLIGNLWGYIDFESLQVLPETGPIRSLNALAYGAKFALSQHHFGYIGVQDKFLGATADMNGINNTQLVSRREPVIVAGLKFKY